MQKYKIVASDLDGTLLQDDMTVSAENAQAITEIAAMGVQFVPATGRTLAEMPDEVICTNAEHVAQYVLEHYLK